MAIVQPSNNTSPSVSYSHLHNSGRYFAGRRVPNSSPEIDLLSTLHIQISNPLSPISYKSPNLKEHLFLLAQENNLLRKENQLLKSHLSAKETKERRNTLLVEARAPNLLVHQASEVILKLQFLEKLFDTLVEMGVLGDQNMRWLEWEMQRASVKDVKGEEGEDDTETPNLQVQDPDSQVALDIRPYVPRFLKPITTASSLHDPLERTCVGIPVRD